MHLHKLPGGCLVQLFLPIFIFLIVTITSAAVICRNGPVSVHAVTLHCRPGRVPLPLVKDGCPVDSSRANHLCLWHVWCPALINGKLQNLSFSWSVQPNVRKKKGLKGWRCPSQSWLTSGGLRCSYQIWCYRCTSGSQPPPHRSSLLTNHCRCDWNRRPIRHWFLRYFPMGFIMGFSNLWVK